jgi:hypothetical protein
LSYYYDGAVASGSELAVPLRASSYRHGRPFLVGLAAVTFSAYHFLISSLVGSLDDQLKLLRNRWWKR